MRNHIRLIYVAALLTGIGITVFQLIWANNTYTITRNNFNVTASNVLQKTIDDNITALRNAAMAPLIRQLQEMVQKEMKNMPSITNFKIDTLVMVNEPAVDSLSARSPLDSAQLAQAASPPANMPELTAAYQKALAAKHITLPVQLTNNKGLFIATSRKVFGVYNTSCEQTLITASFSGITAYMLRQNAWTFGVSAFLILLTWLSLWYMLYIIRRQLRLDTMKNDFINNMTHELRTPLAILRSTHEAIDQFGHINNKERTLRYLQTNHQVIDLMDKNIDRILQIAQYENKAIDSKPETINLKVLLENIIQRFPTDENTVIRLQYQLPQEEQTTDVRILETIVSNLLDNALKYAIRPLEIIITLKPAGNNLLLEIKDNGIGIDKAHLPYIFDKFYRVPTGNVHDVKGYGIGLSYVKTLTAMLNGRIHVQSSPGKGTTFSIQFPQL